MARCVATMVLFQMCEFDTGNVGASERLPKSEMKIGSSGGEGIRKHLEL